MKRIMYACLTLLLAVLLCAPGLSWAETAQLPLKVSIELSNNVFTKPEEITVTIKVTNSSETDMPGPVTLYYPDGKLIEEFGSPTLAAGQSKSWTGTWAVTQAQLDKGRVTFAVNQVLYDDNGQMYNYQKNYGKALIYNGAQASLEVNRYIAPTTAGKDQEVSITYEIINTGTVDITDVTITENTTISKTKGTIASIPVGEKASYTFTATMGTKDLVSRATITYKASGKSSSVKKEDATIKYGEVKLQASLSADKKGGTAGETVKLTLTLKNTGKVDYQSGTVTDALLGELFTGVSIPAGKTVTLEKNISVMDTASYQFLIAAQTSAGDTVETASGRVTVTAIDPSKVAVLSVSASADRTQISTLPGIVRFRVQVSNVGAVEATNVTVQSNGVTLYTFPSILPGETCEFVRDVSVPMTGKYRFDASMRNALDETETYQSNIVQITYVAPTAAPVTPSIPTPAIPKYQELPTKPDVPAYLSSVQSFLTSMNGLLLALTAVAGLLLLVGVVRRVQANAASRRAEDHLERSTTRTYDHPASKKDRKEEQARRVLIEEQAAEEEKESVQQETPARRAATPDKPAKEQAAAQPTPERTPQDSAPIEQTLLDLYPRSDRRSSTPTLPEEEPKETSSEDTGRFSRRSPEQPYRRHRRSSDD